MVVVLSNNNFTDAVSDIIKRDYFPTDERNGGSTDNMSLTVFHQTTANETTLQLHNALEEKDQNKLHKLSLLYSVKSGNIHRTVTAELRNALFFPVITAKTSDGSTTTASYLASVAMPPPQPREPALFKSLNHERDDCSLTTLNANKTANRFNVSPNVLINPSATRFPATKSNDQRRSSRRKRKNCYQDDHTEQHWEGSTINSVDDDSYFTDLDATTIDSYSIRSELRKAVVASKNKEKLHGPVSPSIFGDNDSTSIPPNPFVYQLPQESPRDVATSVVIQQRKLAKKESDRRRNQRSSAVTIQTRPSHRSIKSLRSALKESYREKHGKVLSSL